MVTCRIYAVAYHLWGKADEIWILNKYFFFSWSNFIKKNLSEDHFPFCKKMYLYCKSILDVPFLKKYNWWGDWRVAESETRNSELWFETLWFESFCFTVWLGNCIAFNYPAFLFFRSIQFCDGLSPLGRNKECGVGCDRIEGWQGRAVKRLSLLSCDTPPSPATPLPCLLYKDHV